MTIQEWASLAIICTLGAFSPGPSFMLILAVTVSEGRKAGISASIGHGIGVFLYALTATAGLSALLKASIMVFNLIQLMGALFLMYLGFRILKSAFKDSSQIAYKKFERGGPNRFWDGFLIAVLNPKIAVFFLSLFSQFLIAGQSSLTYLAMAVMAGVIDTLAYLLMVILASTSWLSNFLATYKKLVEVTFGFLLCFLSASLFVKMMLYS